MLVVISTVGMAAVLCLAAAVLHVYRIEGPVHKDLQVMRELLTEMEPSLMALERPHLIVEGLGTMTDPSAISRRLAEVAAMEHDYRDRYAYWKDSTLPASVKKAIADCHQRPEEYFRLVKDELTPALRGDHAGKAQKVIEENINPVYTEYQRAFDGAVKLIHEENDATKRTAADAAIFWFRVMLVLSVVSVASVGLLGWITTRSVTSATQELMARVHEMASGKSDLTARVQIDAKDEIAELAAGINAMIAKIQSVVQRVREGSVQLLSTSAEIAATARQQEGTVQGLSSATAEIAAAVREISATGETLAGTMEDVSKRADQRVEPRRGGPRRAGWN